MSKEAQKAGTSNVLIHTKMLKITTFRRILLILLEQALFSNLSIHRHTSNAPMSETSRNHQRVPRFMNPNRFPVKQAKSTRK